MSGDQAETLLLTSEIAADEIKNIKSSKKSTKPTTITVTTNGLEIESCLNPNALEFFPCYLQKQHQSILDETRLFKEKINEDAISEKITDIEQKRIIKELDKTEHFERGIEAPPKPKIIKCVGIQDTSQNLRIIAEEESNEIIHTDNKLEVDIGKNQLHVLFSSSCEVNKTSSETQRSVSPSSEIENSSLDSRKVKKEKHRQCDNITEIAYKSNIRDRKFENDMIKKENRLENCSDNCNILMDQINETVQDCCTTLIEENKAEKDTETVYLFGKANNTEIKSIHKSNEADMEINTSKDPHKTPADVKDSKKKFNSTSTGTVRKINLSKALQNVETKKEINHKAETTFIQNANATKAAKNNLTTKTNTNSKYSTVITNKPTVQSFKREASKNFNKDAISNRSSSSTEKSSSSIKSYPQKSKVKSAEKPVREEFKSKECIPKSPRATVSSKLRKTETQKRRNLFFDLDTIKMSEFLFK